jgi:hypothetical protein
MTIKRLDRTRDHDGRPAPITSAKANAGLGLPRARLTNMRAYGAPIRNASDAAEFNRPC